MEEIFLWPKMAGAVVHDATRNAFRSITIFPGIKGRQTGYKKLRNPVVIKETTEDSACVIFLQHSVTA